MAVKTFTTGEVLTSADTNTYLANSGLVYITSSTIGTGVAAVNLTGVFSSTYNNYRVTLRINTATAANILAIQLGTGSATTTNYKSFLWTPQDNWTTGSPVAVSTTAGLVISYSHPSDDTGIIDIINPNQATATSSFGSYATNTNGGITAGTQTDATQFTSLHLVVGGGTFTGGLITVYGYRKA
jgi:hypothetical protein